MATLAERRRESRKFKREINGWTLILIRPTRAEIADLFSKGDPPVYEVCKRFVVGWEGVKESQVIVAGSDSEIPFDAATWSDIVEDDQTLWEPINNAIWEAVTRDKQKREDASKN